MTRETPNRECARKAGLARAISNHTQGPSRQCEDDDPVEVSVGDEDFVAMHSDVGGLSQAWLQHARHEPCWLACMARGNTESEEMIPFRRLRR